MKKAVYSGILLVCLATLAMPAVAKGKPQKAHKTQATEQTSEVMGTTSHKQPKPMMCQGLVGLPQISGTTQQQITSQQTTTQQSVQGAIAQQQTSVTTTSVSQTHAHEMEMESGEQQNLRSNRGGQLRGQARAQHVHQMNAAKGKKAKGQKIDQSCGQMQMSTDAMKSGKVKYSPQSDRPTNR